MMNEAKEERELRKDLDNASRDSSSSFTEVVQSIKGCITGLASRITKSIEIITQDMVNSQHNPTQPVNQFLFYQQYIPIPQRQFSWRNAILEGDVQEPYD